MKRYAYAKINLGLRILRKREDGFHDIETVFYRIAVRDELSFAPSTTLALDHDAPSLPHDETNLVLRAARILHERCRPLRGAHITLRKHIPVGAGLGGGSSDAAATLLALNSFWTLNLSTEMLRSIAAGLGSDVSYFLQPGTAYALGKGDVLEYFNLSIPYWILTVYPGVSVPTAWAYSQIVLARPRSPVNLRQLLTDHMRDQDALSDILANDFEDIVAAHYPVVAETRKALLSAGAVAARMSGSGSSVYGFFRGEAEAQHAAARLGHGTAVFLTPPDFHPEE